MKRSSPAVDPPPPPCALNNSPAEVGMLGKDERSNNYPFPNRTTGRTPQHAQQQSRQQKREPQCLNQQSWSNTAYDNSNASWESEWSAPSGTPPIKTDSSFYKRPYPSEWSPSDSSASNSVASSYGGMMHTPQQSPSNSLSASSFYESNGFYNSSGGYSSYGQQNAYIQQPPYGQHHQQYQPPVRMADGAYHSSNRNPSSCPPTPTKQPGPDYHRRQMRYGLDGMPKVQIKREPEEYGEMDGENFTSIFTKSLTSLYSQDTESAYSDESKPYDSDIMVCSTPTPVPVVEEPAGFQRLHPSSGGQYPANMTGDYPDVRNNFGFYENRNQNCDPPSNVVQDIGSDGNQMNSFRYDRPSFDDMHLYASSSSDSKAQAKKRKVSMPNIPPEGGGFTENRKKTPRMMSFKSDSKWTPNSFAFSEIQIKQEPTDDYNTSELNGSSCNRTPGKDSSSGSMGNGNGGNCKTPSQQSDHPKPPPRKRSPGATCFDRFDKKSTPTNKKVSPLSVYAKVQENIVLSVKCRRYKKRTKPITNKEESAACLGREEMENYKRASLTPDQAAHQVMSELLERVCLFNERSVIDGPDLTQMDTMKVKELLMQFCHRYALDYRDFEDVSSVLKPRIIKDKTAKNSERASAIRKRTSTSPVQEREAAEPASRTPKSEKGPKKSNSSHEDSTPAAARRVLRKLPGRVDRSRPRRRTADSKVAPVVTRRYSTRNARDVEEVRGGSDVDIVIDSSTDRESEAGKEAEVRKKSQRLRNKQPVVEMPASERSAEKSRKNPSKIKKEEPRTKSKEKKAEKTTDDSSSKTIPKKKWTRLHMNCSDNLRSSSVEIVDITKSDSPSSSDSNDPFRKEHLSPSTIAEKVKCRSKRSTVDSKRSTSQRIIEKRLSSSTASKKNSIDTKSNKTCDDANRSSSRGKEDSSRGRKGTPKKLQATSENSSPSKSQKKIVTKREPGDSLSESDDSSKLPQNKKTRDSSSRAHSDNKSKLLKSDSKSSESEKSQTDRSKSQKLLKERVKRAFSNLSPAESASSPKLSNENTKNQTADSSLSETDSSSSVKLTKESNRKSVVVKSEPDSKKSIPTKDDSRNQMLLKNSVKDSPGCAEKPPDSFSACVLKKIKKEPQTEEVIPVAPKQEDVSSKQDPPAATTNLQNIQQETKPARVVRNLPIKKIPRRRSSQHSESELQVVLTKLPDSQVSLSNGSVPVEVVRLCESREQQTRAAQMTLAENKIPQSNSDVGKPPVLMRMKENNETEIHLNSSVDKDHSQEKIASSPPRSAPVNLAKETPVSKIIPKPPATDRYSESEDSDCGLVIDLDRRQSVEERVPSPTFQNSEKSDDTSKPNKAEGPSAESLLKEPSLSAKAALEASKKATEDACLLLHLSRSAVPPIPNSIKEMPPIINLQSMDTKTVEKSPPEVKEQSSKEMKETTDRDESILRTLLLETGDIASGSSQEIVSQSQAGPSNISSDSKAKLNQDVMKLLMYQTYQEVAARNPPSEFDEKKIPLEQLTTDINANLLSESEDWASNDPVTIKEKVKKLKNEISCLQFLAEQKEKERIAILCFKSGKEMGNDTVEIFINNKVLRKILQKIIRYKEEVLKRLKIMDHIRDWVSERYKSPSEERSSSDPTQPVATTSTAHNSISTEADVHPRLSPTRQVIQLAYHATVKTDVPTASVTSGESLTSQCGEKLPAVATMIANATENYGVDMRTVSRNSSTTKTIVQEVVSSRESIYSPAATGSPLSQEQRIGESVQIFQKTMSTTRESTFSPSHSRSPSLPELSPGGKSTHHFTKRVFSCSSSSSQSPPSLQPELRPSAVGSSFTSSTSSSFQPHYPLSLVVSASDNKTESSKTLHVSSSSGKSLTEAPKNSPRSSPKRSSSSSYSVWSSVHTGRSSSAAIDLHTDRIGVQETSTKRTTTASHSLMVAPPPTTILQSTLKHPIHQRPRSEASHERPLKPPVEKIFHHKTEEEPRPLSFSSIATTSNSMAYGGHSSGSSTAKSSSTLNGPPRCMGCGISDAKFLCSGCRKHWYCSPKCQTMRWPDHSRVCFGRQYNSSPSSSYS